MIFVAAVVLGIVLGIIIPYNLTSDTLPYVAVAIVAALDSVFGGLVANNSKKFNMSIFIMGLISNAILAVLITWMGNLLGIDLYFAAIVVFGVRIFNNMATMRRQTLDIYFEKKSREKERKKRIAISEHSIAVNEDDESEGEENPNKVKAQPAEENDGEKIDNDDTEKDKK